VNALKTTLPGCQVHKGSGKLVVFERLSGPYLAMSQTRGVQTTLKALKEQNRHCQVAKFQVDIAKFKLGNVATKLEFAEYDSFVAVHSIV
jgi:hypothetical protein